ncbi:hypothetical protein [Sphingopyxis sp.]|uniref:hypothetical protein n=1 Tax=Sphingopyxis sp. TaxID=1908224 RepID=UPI003BAC7B05
MSKPKSIQLFDRLFLGAMVVGTLNYAFRWNDTLDAFTRQPEVAKLGWGAGYMLFIFVGGMLVNLAIWYFISQRASKVAKWIQAISYVIGAISLVVNYANPVSPKGLALGVTLLIFAAYGYATYLLFRPDSVEWFDRKRVDPDTFR